MPRRIYKYAAPEVVGEWTMEMPAGAEILCVEMQGDQLCVWAMVEPDADTEKRTFRVVGTGHPIPDADELTYLSTVQLMGGSLIFHVFEKK